MWRKVIGVLAALAVCTSGALWGAGPDWRAFLANPPQDGDVLFWTPEQRTAGFRLLDRLPFLLDWSTIETGEAPSALPEGTALDLGLDMDAHFKDQRLVGLIIMQDGEVRYERYGLGFTAAGRWTSFSVAKSFTSTLVGAAIKDGHIKSVTDKVSDYVAGLKGSAYDDVTVQQLLTMTSGVAWSEDYDDPKSDVARFSAHSPMDGHSSIVSYMRSLPRAHPPGTVYNYSTGETNLVGVLVREAVGESLASYLTRKVWKPYGMEQNATWLLSPEGEEVSGCCVQAATRDYARFGQFLLDGAEIDGASIVPEGWLESATRVQVSYGEPGRGYGYQWWTYDDGAYVAYGIFGQSIFVDPSRRLVIASNASWRTASGKKHGEDARREGFFKAVQAAVDRELEEKPREAIRFHGAGATRF